jgi:hypothetical protein
MRKRSAELWESPILDSLEKKGIFLPKRIAVYGNRRQLQIDRTDEVLVEFAPKHVGTGRTEFTKTWSHYGQGQEYECKASSWRDIGRIYEGEDYFIKQIFDEKNFHDFQKLRSYGEKHFTEAYADLLGQLDGLTPAGQAIYNNYAQYADLAIWNTSGTQGKFIPTNFHIPHHFIKTSLKRDLIFFESYAAFNPERSSFGSPNLLKDIRQNLLIHEIMHAYNERRGPNTPRPDDLEDDPPNNPARAPNTPKIEEYNYGRISEKALFKLVIDADLTLHPKGATAIANQWYDNTYYAQKNQRSNRRGEIFSVLGELLLGKQDISLDASIPMNFMRIIETDAEIQIKHGYMSPVANEAIDMMDEAFGTQRFKRAQDLLESYRKISSHVASSDTIKALDGEKQKLATEIEATIAEGINQVIAAMKEKTDLLKSKEDMNIANEARIR